MPSRKKRRPMNFLLPAVGCRLYSSTLRTKKLSKDGDVFQILPTAMSLFATLMSAAFLLGMPVEVYYYGTMFIYCGTFPRELASPFSSPNDRSLFSYLLADRHFCNGKIFHSQIPLHWQCQYLRCTFHSPSVCSLRSCLFCPSIWKHVSRSPFVF